MSEFHCIAALHGNAEDCRLDFPVMRIDLLTAYGAFLLY